MTWKQERDLLIAQTMAFVQSVTGKPTDADGLREPHQPLATPDQPSTVVRPAAVLPARLSPIGHSDLRDEVHRRVAAFRARQQAFDRDRNEYCNAMMAKARASAEKAATIGSQQPPKV